jgi:ATP-dependent Clp protease ATP-binding subunit ClpC
MHKHFTKRVEKVVKLASQIAREYDQDYVGTEHLLLAIEREGTGDACRILKAGGVSEGRLKAEVDNLIKKSLEDTWVFGRLPGTPHFRNVVASALEAAERLGATELRTEHLLLALAGEAGSVASRALHAVGCTPEQIEAQIASPPAPSQEKATDS